MSQLGLQLLMDRVLKIMLNNKASKVERLCGTEIVVPLKRVPFGTWQDTWLSSASEAI